MNPPLHVLIINNFIHSVFPWDGKTPLFFDIPADSTIMLYDDAIRQGFNFLPEPEYVPTEIKAYQLREWLIKAGKKQTVEEIIESIPDPLQRDIVSNRWEYATEIPRTNILVKMIGDSIGMTDEQIDQAFIDAAKF